MLRFFRNLRKKSLTEKKIRKYLLYAIGEIFLVVIGILIALYLNNLNEERQLQKKELTYLKELRKTLKSDLEKELKPSLIYLEKSVEAHEKFEEILDVPVDSIIKDSLWNHMSGWIFPWKLQINFSPFKNLESVGMDLISCDSLRSQISQFYGYEVIAPLEFSEKHLEYIHKDVYKLMNENMYLEGTPFSKSQLHFLQTDLLARNLFNVDKVYYIDVRIADMKYLIPLTENLLNHLENDISKLENE